MPDATVIIVTRNHKELARRAIASALAQAGSPEVVVIDDASDDGTTPAIQAEFPSVQIHCSPVQKGYIVQRNLAVQLSSTPVAVSIDDDAEFIDSQTVNRAVQMLANPRIGAVSIPFVNEYRDGRRVEMVRPPPDANQPWATHVFVGTAFAVKRDVFLSLGGFQPNFFHWGEETEYALRLLNAGYVIAISNGGMIVHRPEGVGKYTDRINRYIWRNKLLTQWINAPTRIVLPLLAIELARMAVAGARRPALFFRQLFPGMMMALGVMISRPRLRRPIKWSAYRLFLRIRRRRPVALSEISDELKSL